MGQLCTAYSEGELDSVFSTARAVGLYTLKSS
jgi:hypothetical protein